LALFQVMVLAFAFPWLVKNLILTWNPFAPLLADILPLVALQPSDYYQWLRTTNNWGGYSGSFWDYLKVPWLLTVENNIFMGRPGPIIFPGAILAVIFGWRRQEMRPLILLGSILFFLCLLASKLVRYHTLSFPLLCLIIAGGLWSLNPTRRVSKIQAGLVAGVLLLLLGQLPWFLPLSGSTINTVDRAKIRIFSNSLERWQFLESKLIGLGGRELYRIINQDLIPGRALLAITPGYQSFIDHPVYMAPNSSPSVQMTEAILDYGLASRDLITLETQLNSVRGRYWAVSLPADQLRRPAEFYRPRFYFESGGGYLEIPVFAIRRSFDGNQLRIECDLGASRRVDQIRFWSSRSDQLEVQLSFRSGGSESYENGIAPEWKRISPEAVSIAKLQELFHRFEIDMILYPLLPELSFLDETLAAPENTLYFQEVFRTDMARLLRVLR
ncbi:MAG TPA: hypothetical protein VKZ59_04420, partial [Acidobacteriota bacterium]|nr:hypothetical protein [Acidobacteriota bacterium]